MKEENEGKTKKMPRTISDYALVRRQFAVFERAVKRFKDDKSLWSAYVELARKEKAWVLVGRVCARLVICSPNFPLRKDMVC
jgi:U3 small nucleolar RNA-associated protein 6